MSRDPDLAGISLGLPHVTSDDEHAVEQLVLRRALAERWTRTEILQVLETLGLVEPAVAPPSRTWASGARKTG